MTNLRNTRFEWECVVVDAVRIEPVSKGKFPANREINREFRENRPSAAILVFDQRPNSMAWGQIPYATKQEIFAGITGNFFSKNREFSRRGGELISPHLSI